MNDWLDSWMPRRLPVVLDDRIEPPAPNVLPLADTMFILRHGKKAWRNAQSASIRSEK